MCRWLAYYGPSIALSRLLTKPSHSMIDQSVKFEKMIGHVEQLRKASNIVEPISFSAVATDGMKLVAVRYASDGVSPTLYHSYHAHAMQAVHNSYDVLPDDAVVVLSEPLDDLKRHWRAVPESSIVLVEGGKVTIKPFKPFEFEDERRRT